MAIELRQQLQLSQQLIMTPQLQMAIKLLQLSRLELLDTIQQELEENPALEEVVEQVDEHAGEETESVPEEPMPNKEVTIGEKMSNDIDWDNYIDEYNTPGRYNLEIERKETLSFDAFVAKKESLDQHLLWQLLMISPTEEEEKIGSLIIGNLNRDGYLDVPVDEIARLNKCSSEKVENILAIMQTFDPVGVCARDLKECLLIQANHFGLNDTIVPDIIKNHLNFLENNNYKAIAKALGVGLEAIRSAVTVIRQLEPRPGRQFSDDDAQYITPDIYVYKMEGEFVVLLNDDGMPKLRVSQFYRHVIRNDKKVSDKARSYIHEKLNSATWLIRSIHQRQKTIYRVMQSILKFQRPFFDKGIAHLRPLVLRDIAQDIGMHESTISRVTTNKYAHTPQGIFELKYFFNSSINRIHGGAIASASVQEKIRKLIEGENNKKPYSDNKIVQFLEAENIDIARRTVAKYREILKILPSNKRKKF